MSSDTIRPSSQPQLRISMSSVTIRPSSQPQLKMSMSSDRTWSSFQPQLKPAISDDKRQPSSQLQPRLVTFNNKMKEDCCLVKNVMNTGKKEDRNVKWRLWILKLEVSHPRNEFQSLV